MAENNPPNHPAEHAEHGASASHAPAASKQALPESGLEREGASFATAALIGVGVAILEPELIPGMLIGAGAWAAPKVIPALGGMLRPMAKGLIKAGYSAGMAVREMVAEASEQVEDIVAEARAEHQSGDGAEPRAEAEERQKRQRRPARPNPAVNL